MRLAAVAAASVAVLAGAADAAKASSDAASVVASLPQCVQDCLGKALESVGCDKTDYGCGCGQYAPATLHMSTCLESDVLSPNCDVSKAAAIGTNVCTDFTSDDIKGIESAVSSIGMGATSILSGVTNLVTPTATPAGDSAPGAPGSGSKDAGPQITPAPLAWAGAAIALVALAL